MPPLSPTDLEALVRQRAPEIAREIAQAAQDARVEGAVIWANGRIGPEAVVGGAIAGRHVHVGRGATVGAGAVLGDKTTLTDFSKV